MGIMTLLKDKPVYLDTNVFIYMLEGYPEFLPLLTQLFKALDNKHLQAITSELTLAEALVKPFADKNISLQKIYEHTIQSALGLTVIPISRNILIKAAKLRTSMLRLPDAIHLATAQENDCKFFITNDAHLKKIPDINILLLSEIKSTHMTLE